MCLLQDKPELRRANSQGSLNGSGKDSGTGDSMPSDANHPKYMKLQQQQQQQLYQQQQLQQQHLQQQQQQQQPSHVYIPADQYVGEYSRVYVCDVNDVDLATRLTTYRFE